MLTFNRLLRPGLIWQTLKELIATEDILTHTGNFSFFPHSIQVLFILQKRSKKALQKSMVTRLDIVKRNNDKSLMIWCNECVLFQLWNMSHPLTYIIICLPSCTNGCHGYKTRIQGPLFEMDFTLLLLQLLVGFGGVVSHSMPHTQQHAHKHSS